MTIEEILALTDKAQRIEYLKKGRRTEIPDVVRLYNDWNPNKHEIITDNKKLPLIILLVIYGVELESIYVNYFAAKGKKVKVNVFKFFSKKNDIIEVEEKEDKEP